MPVSINENGSLILELPTYNSSGVSKKMLAQDAGEYYENLLKGLCRVLGESIGSAGHIITEDEYWILRFLEDVLPNADQMALFFKKSLESIESDTKVVQKVDGE